MTGLFPPGDLLTSLKALQSSAKCCTPAQEQAFAAYQKSACTHVADGMAEPQKNPTPPDSQCTPDAVVAETGVSHAHEAEGNSSPLRQAPHLSNACLACMHVCAGARADEQAVEVATTVRIGLCEGCSEG